MDYTRASDGPSSPERMMRGPRSIFKLPSSPSTTPSSRGDSGFAESGPRQKTCSRGEQTLHGPYYQNAREAELGVTFNDRKLFVQQQRRIDELEQRLHAEQEQFHIAAQALDRDNAYLDEQLRHSRDTLCYYNDELTFFQEWSDRAQATMDHLLETRQTQQIENDRLATETESHNEAITRLQKENDKVRDERVAVGLIWVLVIACLLLWWPTK